jgi:exodeoxyribonuclease-3
MKILCWNIVSLKALIKKTNIIDNTLNKNNTLENFIDKNKYDIICFQEIKLNELDLNNDILNDYFEEYGYQYVSIPHQKKGYSGVCILSKIKPLGYSNSLIVNGESEKEGRFIMVEYDKFYLINVYFPNAGDHLKRLNYKDDFNNAFYNKVKKLKEQKEVIIVGDFNAIQYEFDTYNFDKHYNKLAGVTDLEMDFLNKLVDKGFLNIFRELYPNKIQYSYFSYRFPSRVHNKGLLIDYILSTSKISKKIKNIKYLDNIYGSDHLPFQFTLNI